MCDIDVLIAAFQKFQVLKKTTPNSPGEPHCDAKKVTKQIEFSGDFGAGVSAIVHRYVYILYLEPQTTSLKWMFADFQPFPISQGLVHHPIDSRH